jgi:hypothetical protein
MLHRNNHTRDSDEGNINLYFSHYYPPFHIQLSSPNSERLEDSIISNVILYIWSRHSNPFIFDIAFKNKADIQPYSFT